MVFLTFDEVQQVCIFALMIRILTAILLPLLLSSCTYYIGPNHWANSFSKDEVIVPHRTSVEEIATDDVLLAYESLEKKSSKKILQYSAKFEDTTINVRTAYAKLLLAVDIEAVNEAILKTKAWGTTGTSGKLNKRGDYDFSQIQFTHLIWYFKDSPHLLYPETAQHIVDYLIIDNGARPTLKAPKTLGIVRETENHILMKETSRYLKNQWIFENNPQAEFDNTQNGMTDFLIEHLLEMKKTGFYEFNSNPYISYTFEALHILHMHSKDQEIKQVCKEVMDAENYAYALGSFELKKYSPFRRRMTRVTTTSLFGDRHGVLIRAELAKSNKKVLQEDQLPCCFDRTLISSASDYILPEETQHLIEKKSQNYYAKIGHGLKASPEIYYGTPDYLLTGGGLRIGKRSQIVPRPLSILLKDEANDIKQCFHIEGKGKLNKWNNTGLYPNIMIGENQVYIPKEYARIDSFKIWDIYKPYPNKDIYICVYNGRNLGIIFMGQSNYQEILSLNLSDKQLSRAFNLSASNTISYKTAARKKWVIKTTPSGRPQRKFKRWKRFNVNYESN